jgi:hypothetical protein
LRRPLCRVARSLACRAHALPNARPRSAKVTVNISLDTFTAERSGLAADVLRASGRLRLQVRGESMLPVLWPRDVVEIESCSIADVRPGDIVLALRGGRFFLHRFLAHCDPSGFLLQGDSTPAPDPEFPDEALLGRLAGCEGRCADQRFTGQRQPAHSGARRQFAGSRLVLPLRPWSWAVGRLLCYCGPARRLVLKLHALREQHRNNAQNAEGACQNAAVDLGAS